MSGFEIAGIVLAAFPLLLEGAQKLSGIYKDVKFLLQFEAAFERFLMKIEDEQIAYSQMLDLLLDPLEAVSLHNLENLKDNPSSPLWKDAHVLAALKTRLQKRNYRWFMIRLRRMNKAIERLCGLLPIGEAHSIDSSDLKIMLQRFHTCFSHEKDELLAEIKDANETLYGFLQKSVTVQNARFTTPSKATSGAKSMASIMDFQEHARLVLKSLQQSWACSVGCAGTHPCSISVQGSDIMAFLSSGQGRKHIRFELRNAKEIRRSQNPPSNAPPALEHQDVRVLIQQVPNSKRRKVELETEGPRSILTQAELTFTASSKPFSSGADVESGGIERAAKKLTKRQKKVGIERQILPPRAAPAPVHRRPSSPREDRLAIKDMCGIIANECNESCLGFLDSPDAKLYLYLEPHSQPPSSEAVPLDSFIVNAPDRGVRLSLGHAITWTVFHLGSAWIPDILQQSSLLLLRTSELYPQPYIYLPAIPTATQSTSSSASLKAQSSLLRLGIVLLELLFRETLESQPFRKTYFDGGKPNDMTDWCTALTWQKKVDGEFGPRLAKIIERCLRCSFEPSPDLGNPDFIRSVWVLVVQPLDDWIQDYKRRT